MPEPSEAELEEAKKEKGQGPVRLYPFGVNGQQLERALRAMRLPAVIAPGLDEADLVLTVKSKARQGTKIIVAAQEHNLPVHVIKELNTVLRARRHLEANSEREPTADDIAHLLGRPAEEVRSVLVHNERMASLDAPLEIDPMLSIGESIADEQSASPEAQLAGHEIESLVKEWLAQLNDKQRTVIERRFGLSGQEVLTLERLAEQLALTRERVRQIQLEALVALRGILRRRGLSKDVLL